MVTELKVKNNNCFTTKTTVINIYSGLNPNIDIIVNILDVSREQEAKGILEDAFSNWFENDDVSDIPVGDYLKMCLDKAGIEYEMYFKDTDDEEDSDYIQTSPSEKHYGVEDAEGESIEIIVSTPVTTRFLLTDCNGSDNEKPLVFNTFEDARKEMRLKAAEYIRLWFKDQLEDVIYDEGHNLVTVDGVQLADIILDYADDSIDGVDVYDNEIRIYYGDDAYKTLDRNYNNLKVFEIPV